MDVDRGGVPLLGRAGGGASAVMSTTRALAAAAKAEDDNEDDDQEHRPHDDPGQAPARSPAMARCPAMSFQGLHCSALPLAVVSQSAIALRVRPTAPFLASLMRDFCELWSLNPLNCSPQWACAHANTQLSGPGRMTSRLAALVGSSWAWASEAGDTLH